MSLISTLQIDIQCPPPLLSGTCQIFARFRVILGDVGKCDGPSSNHFRPTVNYKKGCQIHNEYMNTTKYPRRNWNDKKYLTPSTYLLVIKDILKQLNSLSTIKQKINNASLLNLICLLHLAFSSNSSRFSSTFNITA